MTTEIKIAQQTSVVTEKDQYYVMIGVKPNQVVIGIGKTNYTKLQALIAENSKLGHTDATTKTQVSNDNDKPKK